MKKLIVSVLFALLAVSTLATSAKADPKDQPRDPRIGQQQILALINMDPVDVNYVTDYHTRRIGLLMVPAPGQMQSKSKGYKPLAAPAGLLIDFPMDAKVEPFTFVSENGDKLEGAVKVTLAPNTEAKVVACGNGDKPDGPMIVKLLEPQIEIKEKEVIKEVPGKIPDNLATKEDLVAMGNLMAHMGQMQIDTLTLLKSQTPDRGNPEAFGRVRAGVTSFVVTFVVVEGAKLVWDNNHKKVDIFKVTTVGSCVDGHLCIP